ncbi:FG-GAP-like repeat-containing protein [Streptomyces sp. NPDC098077]|uniref:FG-GAP-like repeat-containing protein n=1 Tax=Streptomyces sp. NPDC098077 TaxID=3366093 RepID=UPI0037F5ADC4
MLLHRGPNSPHSTHYSEKEYMNTSLPPDSRRAIRPFAAATVVLALIVTLLAVSTGSASAAALDETLGAFSVDNADENDYREFIEKVSTTSTGTESSDGPVWTNADQGSRYISVPLSTGDQTVTLVVRASNLYVVGYLRSRDGAYYTFADPETRDVTFPGWRTPSHLHYDGSYTALERRSGRSLEDVTMGRQPMVNAINTLNNVDPNTGEAAPRALQTLITMISESTRFSTITSAIADAWYSGRAVTEHGESGQIASDYTGWILNWSRASDYARSAATAVVLIAGHLVGLGDLRRNYLRVGLGRRGAGCAAGRALLATDSQGGCQALGFSNLVPMPSYPFKKDDRIDPDGHVYFFSGNQYAEIDPAPGSNDDQLLAGPKPIAGNWPSLEQAGFGAGVDAALPVPGEDHGMWVFSGDQYARIRFSPGSLNEEIVVGPKPIKDNWPSLTQSGFDTGVNAALPVPGTDGQEAWFFQGDRYVRVKLDVGGRDDTVLIGPKPIADNWPSLAAASLTAGASDHYADFTALLTGAMTNPAKPDEAYFFSGSQYVRIRIVPGTTDDTIVNGPKAIAQEWPSLVQAGFFPAPVVEDSPWSERDLSQTGLAVMPLGDSITQGVGSSGNSLGYRKELGQSLKSHVGSVDFVGSLNNGDGSFDGDHEGHSGWRIDELTDNGYAAGDLDTWLPAARPNVITLMAGTNDLNRGASTTPEQARDRMDVLLGKIHAMAPDMTVLLGSIPPADPATSWARFQPLFTRYNQLLPALVDTWRAKGMKVRFVEMSAVGGADMQGGDGLHPTASGYTKIAAAFSAGVARAAADGWITQSVDVVPAPPSAAVPSADGSSDVDGDGRDDYLVVGDNGEVTAYLNRGGDGNGGFVQREFASGPAGATAGNVRFADVNGDSKADYLTVGDTGQVTAWINQGGDGAGGFAEPKAWAAGPAGASAGNVRFADVNGDGRADYLVVGDAGQVRAWISRGGDGFGGFDERPFASGTAGATAGNVRFADADGDGKDDYLIVRDNGQVDAWINQGGDGAGGFAGPGKLASGPAGANPGNVRFADVNGDRRADYLMVGDSGQVTAWINNGGDSDESGWLARGRISSGVGFPIHQSAFADVDGDTKADYLGTSYSWSTQPYEPCVWANRGGDGQGGWTATSVRTECIDPAGASGMVRSGGSVPGYSNEQYADLNDDGRADRIIVNTDDSVDAELNTGGTRDVGRWAARTRIAAGAATWSQVRFADVNGDGRADYLTVDENGKTMASLNQGMDGSGGWGPHHQVAAGPGGAGSGSQVRFADVNGDGRADYLLVADNGSVQAWLNDGGDGAGGWTFYDAFASGTGGDGSGHRVLFADIDGDGRADYLLLTDDGKADVWINNGGNAGGWINRGIFAAGVAPANRVHL